MQQRPKISKWERQRMEKAMKKKVIKLYQKNEKFIESIQEAIAVLIEKEDEHLHPHMVGILCASIICGFDEHHDREEVVKITQMIVEQINGEENGQS